MSQKTYENSTDRKQRSSARETNPQATAIWTNDKYANYSMLSSSKKRERAKI